MNKEILLFTLALIVSLILHILIVFSVYYPGNFISMPLTAGMIFSWLYTSSTIKDLNTSQKDFSFKIFLANIHPVLRYFLLFLALYALVNFINTFSAQQGSSWVDFDLGHNKLKGISGFWILFYMVGFVASYIRAKLVK